MVATFLPSEVVDSLYAVMQKAGLEVASMTLEPIAALNAAIPADLRLLNLALVDIGAGTSDIAVCRDGSVVGYTMATVAGDEITEALMRACLLDFPTAEAMKLELGRSKSVSFTDILGLEQTLPAEELFSLLDGPIQALADEIAQRICQVNGGPPLPGRRRGSAPTLCARVAAALGIDSKRAALAGGYFQSSYYLIPSRCLIRNIPPPVSLFLPAPALSATVIRCCSTGAPLSSSAAGALRCWNC